MLPAQLRAGLLEPGINPVNTKPPPPPPPRQAKNKTGQPGGWWGGSERQLLCGSGLQRIDQEGTGYPPQA